jgi:hypothetical protein
MKPLFFVLLVVVCAVKPSRAGPTDNAIVAAMKLSEQSSYSWTTAVSDDARTYDIAGRTDRSGYTWMRLPLVKEFARRLGRDAETELEAVFHGSDTYVVRTARGWKTLQELPKYHWNWSEEMELWPAPASTRASLGAAALAGLDPRDAPAFPPPMVIVPPLPDDDAPRPYSNAQFALSHPHDELAVIVGSYLELKVDGRVARGTLSDIGAQLLLVRPGQDHLKPLRAAGVFRLLIQDGIVTRYDLRLEGILLVDRKTIHVCQESSTVISHIGATTVEVPDEARRKLGL